MSPERSIGIRANGGGDVRTGSPWRCGMPLLALSGDTLARWQFATTTIYHFLFVPVSIGLSLHVAAMQTLAYRRRGTPEGGVWDRAAQFWGRLMLVVFAIGIVT